jgi:small subunit ribosomal protein S10
MISTTLKIKLDSFTPVLLYKNLNYLQTLYKGIISPLPTKKKYITVLRSPHVDKKSREQFELSTHSVFFLLDFTKSNVELAMLRKNIFSGVRGSIYMEVTLSI